MTDEWLNHLEHLPRRPAPADLRGQVLAAVDRELSTSAIALPARRKPRWERALEWATAACVLLGVGTTAWQWQAERAWSQRVFAPQLAAHRSTSESDALAAADSQLAQLLRQRILARPLPEADRQRVNRQHARLLQEIAALTGEVNRATQN